MIFSRRSLQPWVLRFAAFVLFISGGALAQRYLSSEATLKALPLERSKESPKPQAILLESHKLEIVHALTLDATAHETVQWLASRTRVTWTPALSAPALEWHAPRAFDAQAPPQSR